MKDATSANMGATTSEWPTVAARIHPTANAALEAVAAETGESKSELIREAIDGLLARRFRRVA